MTEGLTVTELKEQLEKLGIPTNTPNLVGEARFIELQLRYRSAQSLVTKTEKDDGGTSRTRSKIQGLKEVSSSYGKEEDEAEDMFHFDLGANLDEDDDEEEDDEGEEDEGEDEEVENVHPSVPTPPPRSTGMVVPPKQAPPPPTGPPPKSPFKYATPMPTETTNESKTNGPIVPPPSHLPSTTIQKTKLVDDDDNLSVEPDDEEKDDDDVDAERAQLKEFCKQGKLQESLQDYGAAEYAYQQALRIDPLDVKTLTLFAVFLHRKRGEMDRAEAFFGRALQQCVPALFNAVVQSSKRKIQIGSEKIETSTSESKSPTNKAPISLGVNTTLTTTQGGLSTPNCAPGRNGNRIKNHDVVCLLLKYAKFLARAQGDVEGASAVYKKAVEIEPNNAFILGSAAHFLASESGDREEALTLYSRALKADPSNALHALWYVIPPIHPHIY